MASLVTRDTADAKWNPWFSSTFLLILVAAIFESASGLCLYMAEDMSRAIVVVLFLHLGVGVMATIPFIAFMPAHLRTVRLPDVLQSPVDRALRHSAWIGLLASLLTGVYLFVAGTVEHRLIWRFHVLASAAGVLSLLLHVVYKQFAARAGKVVHRASRIMVIRAFLISLVFFAMIFSVAAGLRHATRHVERPIDYDAVESDALFLPANLDATFRGLAQPQALTNSKACGLSGCHEGLYKEWKESAHYWSTNPFFLKVAGELKKQVGGPSAVRVCGTCHAPVATLTGNINAVSNASADEATARRLAEEESASSCVFCHSIAHVGRFANGDNVVSEPAEYVFTDGKNEWLNYLYKRAVSMKPEAHSRSYTRPFYSDTQACGPGCHCKLQMSSWVDSPYLDKQHPENTKHCQACHMPEIPLENEIMTALRGKTKSHRFLASGATLPGIFNNPDQARLTQEFISDQKILMGLSAPAAAAPGSSFPLMVSLLNNKVGHYYPAGPALDLIEAWLEVIVTDEKGDEIYATGVPDAAHHLPKETYVYTLVTFDHRMQMIETLHGTRHVSWYDMWAMVHAIPPDTVDDVRYTIPLPRTLQAGRLRVKATLRQRRPSQAFLDWGFPGTTAPPLSVATAVAEVPVKTGAGDAPVTASAFPDKKRCDPYYLHFFKPGPVYPQLASHQAQLDFQRGSKLAFDRVAKLRQDYPPDPDTELAYADMLLRLGRVEEADGVLQGRLPAFEARKPRQLQLLAQVAEARGDADSARKLRMQADERQQVDKNTFFRMDRFRPPEMQPAANNELRRRINSGYYDRFMPYVILNRNRLKEMSAGWGEMPETGAPPREATPR